MLDPMKRSAVLPLRFPTAALLLACVSAHAAPDPATTTSFTEHALLEDLGERGLPALVDRWAADPPDLGDPATPLVLVAARRRPVRSRPTTPPAPPQPPATTRACSGRPTTPRRRRCSESRRSADSRRTPRSPRTRSGADFAADLAEALLVGRLERRLRHADLFAAYGRVPAGTEPVAPALAEALAAAQEASRAADALRNRFGRDRAAEAEATDSGLRDAVLVGVAERRAPMFTAAAALGLATLPPGDRFFEKPPAVPLAGRRDEPAAERARLLELARRAVAALLDGTPGALEPAGRLLSARIEAAAGDPAAAVAAFRDAEPELPDGRLAVTARLGLAASADAAGDAPAAEEALAEAADLAEESRDPVLSLLVADAASRRASLAGDTAAAAAAYADLPPRSAQWSAPARPRSPAGREGMPIHRVSPRSSPPPSPARPSPRATRPAREPPPPPRSPAWATPRS